MAFPAAPTIGDAHQEGQKNYEFVAPGVWIVVDTSGAGGTNLGYTAAPASGTVTSDTGNDATVPVVDATNAGLMIPADKTKLDTVETNAAADQNAAEVPYDNTTSGLTATTTQAAIDEINAKFGDILGNYTGSAATSAGLDALTDPNGGAAPDDSDWAILTADEGGREAGVYVRSGGAWGAAPVYQFPDAFNAAAAILSDTLTGDAGTAVTYARSDHRHAQSRGAVLPATDGSAGIHHVLIGHATLPDGDYHLGQDAGGTDVWVQS